MPREGARINRKEVAEEGLQANTEKVNRGPATITSLSGSVLWFDQATLQVLEEEWLRPALSEVGQK